MAAKKWNDNDAKRCACGARISSYMNNPKSTRCRHCNQNEKAIAADMEEKRFDEACRASGHRAPRYIEVNGCMVESHE